MTAKFFRTPAAFRAWLEKHHTAKTELLVGFYKTGSGKASITWPESVDEALCFGWIDGVRRGIDAISYSIRFTPRKPAGNWSVINIKRVEALSAAGRMTDAGLRAFAARRAHKSGIYAYEQASGALDAASAAAFRKNQAAWAYFQTRPPSYIKSASWWVTSAKKEETRRRRLAKLMDDSAHGRLLAHLSRWKSAR